MRADAWRNRIKVLDAATELFATGGTKVQIEDIARKAGVGVGTVCRNFATKDDLLEAVLTICYQELLDQAQVALERPDPAEAFAEFVMSTSEFQSRHRALAEQMKDVAVLPTSTLAVREDLFAALTVLVRRAQAAGSIRSDLGAADVGLLFAGIAQASSSGHETHPELRERHVRIVLDGLRPAQQSTLPGRPLEWSDLSPAPED